VQVERHGARRRLSGVFRLHMWVPSSTPAARVSSVACATSLVRRCRLEDWRRHPRPRLRPSPRAGVAWRGQGLVNNGGWSDARDVR
jgi:hypothetical protein